MDEKLISKDIIIKVVRAYVMYVFAFVGVATLLGIFLFKHEQTKEEIIDHLILGLIMSVVFLIMDNERQAKKLLRDQIESEK